MFLFCNVSIILSPSVYAIGLNYRLDNYDTVSGESFCINGYYLFNTEQKSMSGHLEVEGDLIKFLPYYQLIQERDEIQVKIEDLRSQMKATTDEVERGKLDAKSQQLKDQLNTINNEIRDTSNYTEVVVEGLSQDILNQYKNDSAGLRDYLNSHGLLKSVSLCLKAPIIENEIKGDCYTKYYHGKVLLTIKEANSPAMGSSISSGVSAPLDITVRCKKGEGLSTTWLLIIGGIVILVIGTILVIILKKRNNGRQTYDEHEKNYYVD